MARINILPPAIANLIAAGEVVERPASVVKELLENSFDADAHRVEIEIKEGGLKYIAVRDNGLGMDAEDLKLAVLRHATSKIASLPDLDNITTMGFRGEALPSIAAVSKLLINSRSRQDVQGHQIEVHGGETISFSPVGCPAGTFVCVQDLFFNTPARRKYLKSAAAEAAAISDFVTRLALARPDVSITYKNNQRQCLYTPGNNKLSDVINAVYGVEVGRQMLPVSYTREDMQLSGYISPPALQRSTPRYLTTIVNQRYVKCRTMVQAVLDVYQSILSPGRYPIAVLSLRIDPRRVDVNVHPAKMEIKLQDEQAIYLFIRQAIQKALASTDPVPSITIPGACPVARTNLTVLSVPPTGTTHAAATYSSMNLTGSSSNGDREQIWESLHHERYLPEKKKEEEPEKTSLPELTPVGYLPPVYILATDYVNFYIIDHHAAHERILYEKLMAAYNNSPDLRQNLLIPRPLHFTFQEAQLLQEQRDMLERLGIFLEYLGGNSFMLRSWPVVLPDDEHLIYDITAALQKLAAEKSITPANLLKHIAQMAACKAAAKAGKVLAEAEARELLAELGQTENPYQCPHGRPTILKKSLQDIAAHFKRSHN
ncbi:MAG: DNA mismatch repair endonuclease MutL [Bacillota bacterium]